MQHQYQGKYSKTNQVTLSVRHPVILFSEKVVDRCYCSLDQAAIDSSSVNSFNQELRFFKDQVVR